MGTFSGYTDLSVILVNHFVSQFDNYTIKLQFEEGDTPTKWKNAEFKPDGHACLKVNDEYFAELIVEDYKINMNQLGYFSNHPEIDCHDSISSYLRLCQRDEAKYTLFFPTGKWYFSETDIQNERKGVKLEGVKYRLKARDETGSTKYVRVKGTGDNITKDSNGWAKTVIGTIKIDDTDNKDSNPTFGYTTNKDKATIFITDENGEISIQNLVTNYNGKSITYHLEEIENPVQEETNDSVKEEKTHEKSAKAKAREKNQRYYIRIRTYKTVSGKKYYSAWSAVKSVKVTK